MWGDEGRAAMKDIVAGIQGGSVAHEFREDSKNGKKWLREQRRGHGNAPCEEVGGGIRSMFRFARH